MATLPAITALPSVVERLLLHVGAAPTKRLFTYLGEDGAETATMTYTDVETRTRNLALYLLDPTKLGATLVRGDRVLLVFLPSLDFILTFIACLRAGLIAVPVYPPDPSRMRAHITAFTSVCHSCGARVALSHSSYRTIVSLASLQDTASKMFGLLRGTAPVWPDLHWVSVDAFVRTTPSSAASAAAAAARAQLDSAPGDAVAFLQYTSGSTADPKGVMITHSNLAHNLRAITTSLSARDETVVVSWLPQYHDMGLIGSHLGVIYCGGAGVYMSPVSFIKRPVMWVEAMSKYRATHVQSPNFGYALAARKWDATPRTAAAAKVDLSSVRHMFNAAEPLTCAAIHAFMSSFRTHGLSDAAMAPGYGLAEHTVYVCDGGDTILRVDRAALETRGDVIVASSWPLPLVGEVAASPQPRESLDCISCGPVAPWSAGKNDDVHVAIVDGETDVPVGGEDRVGEVWLSSPSVAAGYWGDHMRDASAAAFHARVKPPMDGAAGPRMDAYTRDADVHFLRTGDQGFVHAGQLYICGRIKDMIIIRGRNYYPQDIEQTAEKAAQLRPGCSAAFQVRIAQAQNAASASGTQDDEGVALIAEVRDASVPQAALATALQQLRASIIRDHGLNLTAVLLLKQGAARKTTSGKIARKWNQRAFNTMAEAGSPWHAASGAVLLTWVRAPEEDADVVDVVPDVADAGGATAATVPAAASSPRATGIDFAVLTGDELISQLRQEVATLLREPNVASIDVNTALVDLGMDSLSITQFGGMLQHEYRMKIADQMLFAEGATLSWLAAHATQFRAGEEVALPGPVRVPEGASAGAATAGAATSAEGRVAGVEEVGVIQRPRRQGHTPSWFERNFPCCFCCY